MTEQITIRDLAERLNKAVTLHKEGQKTAAKEKYEEILVYKGNFKNLEHAGEGMANQATLVNNIFSQVYNNMGIFREEENELNLALEAFRKALDHSQGNVEALTNMARVYSKKRNFEGALKVAQKAVSLNPKYIPAVVQLTQVTYNLGLTEIGLKALGAVKKDLETNPRLNIEFGRILERSGDFEGALEKLEKAVELAPRNPYALLNLASINFKLNRFEKALNNYYDILRLKPDHIEALAGLGYLLQNIGQFHEAKEAYKKALGVNQTHDETLGFYASLLEVTGQTQEALSMTERLLAMPKISERAFLTGGLTKAICERKLGQFENAIETLNAIKSQAKNHSVKIQIYFHLGYTYELMNRPGEAFKNFQKANALFLETNRGLLNQGDELASLIENLLATDLKDITSVSDPSKTEGPIFVIGPFMGGSQVLAEILPFLPNIAVYNETHVIEGIRRRLGKNDLTYPGCLIDLGSAEIEHLKTVFDEVNQKSIFKGEKGQTIEIDGSHIVDIPLILKLFPDAKFLFIGSDPRDAVLNTYFKDFPATRTTINFSDLETISSLYSKTMDLWEKFQKDFGIKAQVLKYETLLKKPDQELQKALSGLGYKIGKEAKKALKSEEFTKRLALLESQYQPGRWTLYKNKVEDSLKSLDPYCKKYGYKI